MNFWKKLAGSELTQEANSPKNIQGTSSGSEKTQSAVSQSLSGSGSLPAPNIAESSVPKTPEEVIGERFGKIRSALGPGTVIQGKLSFDTAVRIDGKLSGEIFSSRVLIIGPSGEVDAKVEASSLVVLGTLRGQVNASERIEIWSGGRIEGDIASPVLLLEEGGSLHGACSMGSGLPEQLKKNLQQKSEQLKHAAPVEEKPAAEKGSGASAEKVSEESSKNLTETGQELRVH